MNLLSQANLLSILSCIAIVACEKSTENTHATSQNSIEKETSSQGINPPQRPTQVFWGDTHLHTNLSMDAYTFGVTLGPEDAYRFARGEEVTATHGLKAKLARPLDFLVIADHASGLGSMELLMDGDEQLLSDPLLAKWREQLLSGDSAARVAVADDGRNKGWPKALNSPEIRQSAWGRQLKAAEQYNDPGKFTALIGYEWTSWPGGSNLHRVVVFRDGAERTGQIIPFSRDDSSDPAELWKFLANYEAATGGQVLAIPHNGNLSNGLMFRVETFDGKPMNKTYASERARWEPVVEVTQIKGDGEAHPFLSPNDEFAAYETWDFGNFLGVAKSRDMLEHEYARSALKLGLRAQQDIGANPFKFGMIGSTDSHTSLATADEDNFFGKHSGGMEPSSDRWDGVVGKAGDAAAILGWQQAASGYAAIWAQENTRESLFDAIQRKEVYATTGPRITVRLFGGWDFAEGTQNLVDIAAVGYVDGVPMGGDLPEPSSKSPVFLIAALKDPLSVNLERVQMIKGWVDSDGKTHEQVFNVAWSDEGSRDLSAEGALTPVDETSRGATELRARWIDPGFSPQQAAFYYLRVLEMPSPRWTAHDVAEYGANMAEHVPMTHQERAYTSPIWYTP
ncbi:MAG: DUF3604 domain-containing protein [Pseudomonadota bacterium]